VSETLRHMGLSVEDEVRCPKSGYSIDMIVHGSTLEIGGERSIGGGLWAVEFDGPSHFLASGAPTGATLLKRWHLRVMGHALVSVPCWEWDRCKGACEREQYLRGKLGLYTLEAGKGSALASQQQHLGQPMSSNGKSDVTAPWQALACAAVSRSDTKVSHASRASPRPCTRSDGAADGGGGAAGGGGGAAGGGGISNAWNKPLVSAVLQVSNGDSKSGVHASTFAQDLPRPEFPVTQEACSVQAGADVADEGGWTAVKSKDKSRRLSRTAVKTKDKRVIQQAEFVSEQHHQHMPSKGKSDVTAHAHARVEEEEKGKE